MDYLLGRARQEAALRCPAAEVRLLAQKRTSSARPRKGDHHPPQQEQGQRQEQEEGEAPSSSESKVSAASPSQDRLLYSRLSPNHMDLRENVFQFLRRWGLWKESPAVAEEPYFSLLKTLCLTERVVDEELVGRAPYTDQPFFQKYLLLTLTAAASSELLSLPSSSLLLAHPRVHPTKGAVIKSNSCGSISAEERGEFTGSPGSSSTHATSFYANSRGSMSDGVLSSSSSDAHVLSETARWGSRQSPSKAPAMWTASPFDLDLTTKSPAKSFLQEMMRSVAPVTSGSVDKERVPDEDISRDSPTQKQNSLV